MNFKDLNLKTQYLTNTTSFTYRNIAGQDCEINVKEYLPISDKNDLIQIALQKAEEDGLYNEILLDVYFHLNIVYLYTDIEFSAEDREDEMQLYDILETNGITTEVIAHMGEGEYENLRDLLIAMRDYHMKYDNSAAAVFRRFVTDLPAAAATAAEIVDNFNPEQYNAVRDFAIAANGGRDINTNMPVTNQEKAPIKPPAAPQDHLKKAPQRKILSIESVNKKD